MNAKRSGVAKGYLHGFTKEEQDRLYAQARFLEPSVFEHVDFSRAKHIVEIGCGVGAQTEILLERFPQLHITGVDASGTQLARAKQRHKKSARATFELADALSLPHDDDTFDGAFVCWLLEHVQRPIDILAEARRVMRPGAEIYVCEVQNASLFMNPYSPAMIAYWEAFCAHQTKVGGDPYVGAKVANHLLQAGFSDVRTLPAVHHYDRRTPKARAQMLDYWTSLLLSGAPGLMEAGAVTKKTVDAMRKEIDAIREDPDAVFFYVAMRARARAE